MHSRLMSIHQEVPLLWYAALALISFALAVITVEVFDTHLPVWALVLALLVAGVFLIPVGMIQAITNQQVGLKLVLERFCESSDSASDCIACATTQCRHRTCDRLRPSGTSCCYDDVQDLGLHYHGPSIAIHFRL